MGSSNAQVPLPCRAQHWEPAAAALFTLIGGDFDPGERAEGEQLVSALCVTGQGRHAFHPLLYENFARQSCEPRELVVVDTGEEPSMFMLERRGEDPRVSYHFFRAQQLQPGSPRLQEETGADDLAPALWEDDALEVTEWRRSRPYGTEVKKEGWSKGFKRNLACALAKGAYLVNMEDGCLYAEDYLAFMRQELSAASAVVPQCWHTVALAHQSFRSVDLKNREDELQELPENERLGYGFCQGFLRSAWLKQPFPDKEGPQDRRFMEALRSEGLAPHLVRPTRALAAYGWWQHSAGAKDAPTNINMYSELLMLACRGRGLEKPPEAFEPLLPHVKRATEAYASKRELRLKRMLDTEGTVHLCASCDSAVALQKHWKDTSTHTNPYGCTFDIGQFSRAGGAVAEGREYDDGTTWFPGWIWRMAICRSCGLHLGWRFESRSWHRSGGRGQAALFWGLIWRHLRERRAAAGSSAFRTPLTCPKEHPLRLYATPHEHYACDGCNRQAKSGEHFWGCGACDYDLCAGCKAKVVHSPQSPAPARDKEKAQAEKENQVANNLMPMILLPLPPKVARYWSYGSYW